MNDGDADSDLLEIDASEQIPAVPLLRRPLGRLCWYVYLSNLANLLYFRSSGLNPVIVYEQIADQHGYSIAICHVPYGPSTYFPPPVTKDFQYLGETFEELWLMIIDRGTRRGLARIREWLW